MINTKYAGSASADNPTIVSIKPPPGANIVGFMTEIEELEVEPDEPARVLIDEDTGVVAINAPVRLSTVAIAHGNLTIRVQETPQVSQPAAFSQGSTIVTPQSQVKVDEDKGKKMIVIKEGASLMSLVSGLNALGVTPRDLISILQALKSDGVLQAEIVVM